MPEGYNLNLKYQMIYIDNIFHIISYIMAGCTGTPIPEPFILQFVTSEAA